MNYNFIKERVTILSVHATNYLKIMQMTKVPYGVESLVKYTTKLGEQVYEYCMTNVPERQTELEEIIAGSISRAHFWLDYLCGAECIDETTYCSILEELTNVSQELFSANQRRVL